MGKPPAAERGRSADNHILRWGRVAEPSPSRSRALAGALIAFAIAVSAGITAFLLSDRASTSEYPFLVLWSLPPALLVYPTARRMRGDPRRRAVVATVAGILIGLGWTFAALFLSGGYLLAADFPVLWCWVWGAVAGLLAATTPWTRAGRLAALTALASVGAVSGAVLWRSSRPGLVADVALRATATPEEVEAVWERVLGRPRPGGGQELLPGIRGVGRADTSAAPRLVVKLDTYASDADSITIDRRLRASATVARIRWYRERR